MGWAAERIHESVLSVEVRSPWINPADYHNSANKPAEYCILLTTGGPALRLVGELSEYGEPTTALLEYQDWFTPWTLLTGLTADEIEALLTFAQRFCFVE